MIIDSNSKTLYMKEYRPFFLIVFNDIKRRNRNKKNEEIKKEQNYFWEKNGLLRDRQNETWTTIQVRPKTAPAIAIPSAKEINIESTHGWVLHSELCNRVQSVLITTLEGIADVNQVLVAASLSIKSIESPILLSVFFGER